MEDNKEKCADCGSTEDVKYVVEPYLEEVLDKVIHVWMCPKCYKESCQEI